MDKNRTLILIEVNNNNDIFYKDWINSGYKASTIFKKISKPLRALRRFCLQKNLFNTSIWYEDWLKQLDNCDCVIINMSYLTRHLPFLIAKRYPKIRIICWYWNTIDKKTLPIKTDNPNIEYWSFDEKDCKKYNFHKNVQYYCFNEKEESNIDINSDIYFVGREKGRRQQIEQIKDVASKQNLVCNFNIIDDNGKGYIPYSDVRKQISKSKAILEINKDKQDGFTLRVLESLFYEKKLITNNIKIKESNLYNKNNIFVIGEDNINHLREFINKPYDRSVNKYKKDYKLDTWFNNFN